MCQFASKLVHSIWKYHVHKSGNRWVDGWTRTWCFCQPVLRSGTAGIQSVLMYYISNGVVNSHIECDPTIRQPCFDLPQQQWSLLNRFHTEQGHCGACRRKWRLTDTDLCPCGETQTMSHTVESCPLTTLNGGLSRLHAADEDAVSWLTSWFMTRIREEEEYL